MIQIIRFNRFLQRSIYRTTFIRFLKVVNSSRFRSFSFAIEVDTNASDFTIKFLRFTNWTLICDVMFFRVFLIYDIWKCFYAIFISVIWFKSILEIYVEIRFVILIGIIYVLTSFKLLHTWERHNWSILILLLKEILRKMFTC